MLDASNLPLEENMKLSQELLKLCAENEIILEVEAGVVGGEEDGAAGSHDTPSDKLYTTPEDMLAVYDALHGRWAATCSPQPLAMCMAITSRAASSCGPTF